MRRVIPTLLFACIMLSACGMQDSAENSDQQDGDIAKPAMWVSRIFSHIDSGRTIAPRPLAGEVLRAIVSAPKSGDLLLYWRGQGAAQPVQLEPSPLAGTVVAVFKIPEHFSPGRYEMRFADGQDSSAWLDFEVTTGALLSERQNMSVMARALAEAARPGITMFSEYHPMPVGTIIEDAMSDELTYGPSQEGDWLFYGVNTKAGQAQDEAFWAVGNPVQGLTVVHNPIGPIGWPFGHKQGKTEYAIIDYSNPVNLNNQMFEAAGEDDQGKPLIDEPADPPPPPFQPPPPPPSGHGLSGDLGPCPQGIVTRGIVIQLDDVSGFDWLRGKSAEMLTELGAQRVDQINTEEISTRHKFDPDKLASKIRNAIKDLDCECSEVVITVISHGKAESNGEHIVIFKDRYRTRGSETTLVKKTKVKTADLIELMAKAFHDEGKDCLAVTTLMQPCYSGAVLDEVEDAVKRGAGEGRRNFRVMTASAADQPAWGDWEGENGEPDIYFSEALKACLQNRDFDFNGDGRVSLQEAWPCLLEEVWLRAYSGSGKHQNPKKWPDP